MVAANLAAHLGAPSFAHSGSVEGAGGMALQGFCTQGGGLLGRQEAGGDVPAGAGQVGQDGGEACVVVGHGVMMSPVRLKR